MLFSNVKISFVEIIDATAITTLLNSAYRGESSKNGWTTEAYLIEGEIRCDEDMVKEVMQQPNNVLLKYTETENTITGCVNLQQHSNKVYLGMFAVSPLLQNSGIGKQLLLAAEEYAKHINCNCIYMSVISKRTELINWYNRHGYIDTGERKPFTEDRKTGKHVQPLEFIILEKIINL